LFLMTGIMIGQVWGNWCWERQSDGDVNICLNTIVALVVREGWAALGSL